MNLGFAQIHERKFFSVISVTRGLFLYKIWQRLYLWFHHQPAFHQTAVYRTRIGHCGHRIAVVLLDMGSQKMGSRFG